MVTFKSNGGTCEGYLADGGGPGVVVIQEWWGLVPHIPTSSTATPPRGSTPWLPTSSTVSRRPNPTGPAS